MLEHAKNGRSAALSFKGITMFEADEKIQPRGDWLCIEPLDAVFSNLVYIQHETKPLRGIVKAVGPGCYPKRYDHADKQKRTKMWRSPAFRPTQVKIGDIVELGGLEHGGYAFESFYWGDKIHIMAREEDVAGVLDDSPDHQSAVV